MLVIRPRCWNLLTHGLCLWQLLGLCPYLYPSRTVARSPQQLALRFAEPHPTQHQQPIFGPLPVFWASHDSFGFPSGNPKLSPSLCKWQIQECLLQSIYIELRTAVGWLEPEMKLSCHDTSANKNCLIRKLRIGGCVLAKTSAGNGSLSKLRRKRNLGSSNETVERRWLAFIQCGKWRISF